MKKLISLIKATMSSDMNIFKIKQKKGNTKSNKALPLFLAFCIMFMMWGYSNQLFEQMSPMHLQEIVLSIFVFAVSVFTIVEGIYKSGPLLFNCKDDQLLLSLPIERKTVIFIRIFKFYVFELLFNSIFFVPTILPYIRWADHVEWSFYPVSIIMILFLPIIPIALSSLIGAISTSISSRFKYKNLVQIIMTTIVLLGMLLVSFNMDGAMQYLAQHATSVNDFITKIYYPAGAYVSLVTKFNLLELLVFILVNIIVLIVTILIINKFYFQINSRVKKVTTTKKTKIDDITIKTRSIYQSLVKKELNTFFKIPVFIVNAGFGLVLFLIATISITIKYDQFVKAVANFLPENSFFENHIILILILILITGFMTSITSSVVSLEGRNINILKSLPVKTETILLSKILSALVITTPVLVIGLILLFIKFKIGFIEMILLLVLSVLIPLVSHFIGLIINIYNPKLDADNNAEVVKQSTSSFAATMLGMIMMVISIMLVNGLSHVLQPIYLLLLVTGFFLIVNLVLYSYLIKSCVKIYNKLNV